MSCCWSTLDDRLGKKKLVLSISSSNFILRPPHHITTYPSESPYRGLVQDLAKQTSSLGTLNVNPHGILEKSKFEKDLKKL